MKVYENFQPVKGGTHPETSDGHCLRKAGIQSRTIFLICLLEIRNLVALLTFIYED
jgi:hypothetical protein